MHKSRNSHGIARVAQGFCALGLVGACGAEPADRGQLANGASTPAVPTAPNTSIREGQAGSAQALPRTPALDAGAAQAAPPAAAGTAGTAMQPAAAGAAGTVTPEIRSAAGHPSAGAGGSVSAGAGSAAAFVQPVLRGGKYVWEAGAFSLELDPAHGARITRYALSGENLLTGPEVDALNYGSTFWPSPQQRWSWPPVPELDSDTYTAQVEGDRLVCSSKPGVRAKVSVTKRVRASAGGDVELEYSLKNEDTAPASWAPWEITRVAAGGLSFFMSGERVINAQLPVVNQGGATWYKHDGTKVGSGQKLTADAAAGFLAHVAGRTLFLKQFLDVPLAQQAPAPEAEIAIYAAAGYVELEPQGPYTQLAPGASVTWRVQWHLLQVPQDVPIEVGSAQLLELARRFTAP